jgi:ligand-binding sensor domain-containing protein
VSICHLILRTLVIAGLLLTQQMCWAHSPAPLLSDYTHTSWGQLQEAPADVYKITQTRDGWMWFATSIGLYRFDGVRFEKMDKVYDHPLDSSNVLGLTADTRGGLWVGYRLGGITLFHPEGRHTFGEAEGLPTSGVIHIEAGSNGDVWVGTRDGVGQLTRGAKRFKRLGREVGLPETCVYQILLARDGTQWIATEQGLYFRKTGQRHFAQAWPRVQLLAVAEAPDGTIWARDRDYRYFRVTTSAPTSGKINPAFPGMGMRFGSDGTMWVLHPDGIERRLGSEGTAYPDQRLTQKLGMSGPQAQCFFEDREGNIWIGTAKGIDRLHKNRLRMVALDTPLENPGIAVGPGDAIFIGDAVHSIARYSSQGVSKLKLKGGIAASYRAADGTLYFGSDSGIYAVRPAGEIERTPLPDDLQTFSPQAMLRDNGGTLWVSISSGSLLRLKGSRWSRIDELARFANALTLVMAKDLNGTIWLGHPNNTVTLADDAGRPLRQLNSQSGLDIGAVLQLVPDQNDMWIAGERGVTLYRGGRLMPLHGKTKELFKGVSGLVRSPDGDLWMHGADGIYHIASQEIASWMARPAHSVVFERIDARDGLLGHAAQFRPLPSLLRKQDGTLWFTTSSALFTLDPAHIERNRIAPRVVISEVSSKTGTLEVSKAGHVQLPKGEDALHIVFTALCFTMPDRMQFRYKLTGVDSDWQGPVKRREAFYTNLKPGSYHFEVTAANEDGVWATEAASIEIEILPTFIQTMWFKLLIATIVMALLYAMHAIRVRVLTLRMEARLAERARIARALHDTLLQSIQGLILAFHAHSEMIPKDSDGRKNIDHTLKMAEELLVEGRDEILDLRSPTNSALFDVLLKFGYSLVTVGDLRFEASLKGLARPLRPRVYDEMYSIGREAMFNAARRSMGDLISLSIEYGKHELELTIRDNGCGLVLDEPVSEEVSGRWGLKGIRERAKLIGAELQILSESGKGTSVTLRLKRSLAYETDSWQIKFIAGLRDMRDRAVRAIKRGAHDPGAH